MYIGLAGIVVSITGSLLKENTLFQVANDFYANVGTEAISIAITVILIGSLEERRAEKKQKADLLLQLNSTDTNFAKRTLRVVEARGWLRDGSLEGIDLANANLEGAEIVAARLARASLINANLHNGEIVSADLRHTDLRYADLREASLISADLRHAQLYRTDLRGADLRGANLEGVQFENPLTEEQTVELQKVLMDEDTLLPSGENWHPDVDLSRFFDPSHEQFQSYERQNTA